MALEGWWGEENLESFIPFSQRSFGDAVSLVKSISYKSIKDLQPVIKIRWGT